MFFHSNMNIMEGVKEFLESSTIHGLVYITTTKHLTRLLWIATVVGGFSVATVMIHQSLLHWAVSPVTTTLENHPLSSLPFPRVTVCPPTNTRTTLNLLLEKIHKMKVDEEGLYEHIGASIPPAILDSEFEESFSLYSKVTNVSRGWYLGDTSIYFLHPPRDNSPLRLVYLSSSSSGTVASPDFQKSFDLNSFQRWISFRIGIDVPKNISGTARLILDLQYDTEDTEKWEEVLEVGSSENESSPFFWINKRQDEKLLRLENAGHFRQTFQITNLTSMSRISYFYVK